MSAFEITISNGSYAMIRSIVIGLLTCLVVACGATPPKPAATPAVATPPVAPSAPAAAPPAASPNTPAVGASTDGTATVVFFRPSKFAGGAIGFIVREGTIELGKLRSGKYFVVHVAPGKHTYVVHSEASDDLTIDADAGEIYYIEGEIGMGVVVGHPHIKPSDKSSFEAIRAKLQEVQPMTG
jgi:hypothetical protein